MMTNELMEMIEATNYVRYCKLSKSIIVEDFLGFDEEWNEIMNEEINWKEVEEIEELAKKFEVEIEYTSYDI